MTCSRPCADAHILRMKLSRWIEQGVPATGKNGTLTRWARDYLIRLAGNECPECGWGVPNPHNGKVILTIDHIDGDWQNNRYENLRVLCYNCHTLTPTFGSLNKGNGARVLRPEPRFARITNP